MQKYNVMAVALVVVGICALLAATQTGTSVCNDSSRLATAESLVNRQTFAINESYFAYTCDYLQVDGTMYSDKPPVFSVALAGLYAAVTAVTGWRVETELFGLYYVLTLLTSGLAFVMLLMGVRRIARQLGGSEVKAALVAVAACFGTLAFTYAAVISNHVVAASFLTWGASYLLEDEPRSSGAAIRTGLLLGAALVVDPLAVCFIAPLGIWTLLRDMRRGGWLVLGGIVPVAVHATITYAIIGNPIALNLDPEHFEYAGSIHNARTLTGFGWKHESIHALASYAYDCLIGYRGFIAYNLPAFFGLAGLLFMAVRQSSRWALCLVVGLALFLVLTIGFSVSYSGNGYGIRWHALAAPVIACGLAAPLDTCRLERLRNGALILGLVVGIPLAAIGTLNPMSLWTGKTHSVVKVLDSPEENVSFLMAQARGLHEHDRHAQAMYFAEMALRYIEPVPDLWYISVNSAIAIGDTERLERYRKRLEGIDMPYKDELLQRIEQSSTPGDQ